MYVVITKSIHQMRRLNCMRKWLLKVTDRMYDISLTECTIFH